MNQEAKVVIGIIGACILIFAGIIFYSNNAQEKASAPIDEAILIREDSPKIQGDGSVTLVEFLDPECGACASYHSLVKQVLSEYEGKITYVVRYFPIHSNSVLAAQALEAAGEQNKYWEMLDVVFASQSEWGNAQTPPTELFKKYAQELELDMNRFNEVIESDKYEEKVARDRVDGMKVGVQSTPSFFINGKKIQNNPRNHNDFKDLIDTALQNTVE